MTATPYERFRALHERPEAFVMPNAWDGASAALLARAGFEALGSTSLGLAFSLGRQDGRHAVSRGDAIAHAALLAQTSGLPVNGDLEDGFGATPEACVATVQAAIAAGLAGLGIEDTTADPFRPIHDFDDAVARVRAAAGAARGRILLTGRTDNFIAGRARSRRHDCAPDGFCASRCRRALRAGIARHGCDCCGSACGCPETGQRVDWPRRYHRAASRALRSRREAGERRRSPLSRRVDGACESLRGVARRRPCAGARCDCRQ